VLTRIGVVLGGNRLTENLLSPPFKYNTALDLRNSTGFPVPDGNIQTAIGLGDWLPWGGTTAANLASSAMDESIAYSITTTGGVGAPAFALIGDTGGTFVWA